MLKNDFNTIKRDDGIWVVLAGSGRATTSFTSLDEAWRETRRLARGAGTEAILKEKDGKILTRSYYGQDSYLKNVQCIIRTESTYIILNLQFRFPIVSFFPE